MTIQKPFKKKIFNLYIEVILDFQEKISKKNLASVPL